MTAPVLPEPTNETVEFRGQFWRVADASFDQSTIGVGSHWHLTLTGPLVRGRRCTWCHTFAPDGEVMKHSDDCDERAKRHNRARRVEPAFGHTHERSHDDPES